MDDGEPEEDEAFDTDDGLGGEEGLAADGEVEDEPREDWWARNAAKKEEK